MLLCGERYVASYKRTLCYAESIQCTYYTALSVYLMNNEHRDYIGKQCHKYYASRKSTVFVHYNVACHTCDTDVIRSFNKRCEVGKVKVECRVKQFSDIAIKLVYSVRKFAYAVLCVFRTVGKLISTVFCVLCTVSEFLCSVYCIVCTG